MEKKQQQQQQTRQSTTRSSPRRASPMKTTFCIPRFRTAASRKSSRLSPMSLLDRFREAVFRLIMLSAISKAATANTDHCQESRSSSSSSNSPVANCQYRRPYYYYQSNDPHHSEAVADCIEFIKRSANDRDNRDSIDSTADVVIPLPVM